jgi:hypothetical protein
MAITQEDLCPTCNGKGDPVCITCGKAHACGKCHGTKFNAKRFDLLAYRKETVKFLEENGGSWELVIDKLPAGRKGPQGAILSIENYRIEP